MCQRWKKPAFALGAWVGKLGRAERDDCWQTVCSPLDVKAVLSILTRAQAGDLLVSIRSKSGERALVLVILKGSSGTPVTLVIRAESAIFPFTFDVFSMQTVF